MKKELSTMLLLGFISVTALFAQKPVTLEVWGWNDDQQCLEAVIAEYRKINPHVSINLTIAPVREYDDKLTTALAGGTKIDVMCINGNAPYSQLVSRNQLLPLDTYISRDKFDTKIYGAAFDSYKFKNKTYSIPYRASVIGLAYNKSIFDKLKIPYPTDDMTWEQVFELAKKLTNGEGPNKQYGIMLYTRSMDWMMPAYQTGWTIIDKNLDILRYCMQYKVDAQKDGITMPHSEIKSVGIGIRPLFERERMAMYITGDWTINQLRDSKAKGIINFDWDFVKMPHMQDKPAGNTQVQTVHTAVNAKSTNPQESWNFLKFLAGPQGATIFAKLGTMPAAVYVPSVKEAFVGNRTLPPANIDALFTQTLHDPLPIVNNLKAIDTIFLEESELVWIGEQTIDQAIKKIESRRARYLK